MSDFFGKLGFPVPEQRDAIRFYFAKRLPYATRGNLILGCLLAGLILQILMLKVWTGLPFLVIAVLLGLVKGYDSRIRLKNFRHDETWTEVSVEKIREIETIRRKSAAWDRDSFDITNVQGCFVLGLLAILGLLLCLLAGRLAENSNVIFIMLTDFIILVFPFYFTGVRRALKQGNLSVKVRLLLKLHAYFEKNRVNSESFIPLLLLAREAESKAAPVDVRFQIRYRELPQERFYGLNGTVNINMIQGTSYAFFYCVLVSKPGFGLNRYKNKVAVSSRVMCEYEQQPDAEVLVIRHPTTRDSGYFTDDDACMEILAAAMKTARLIESDKKPV